MMSIVFLFSDTQSMGEDSQKRLSSWEQAHQNQTPTLENPLQKVIAQSSEVHFIPFCKESAKTERILFAFFSSLRFVCPFNSQKPLSDIHLYNCASPPSCAGGRMDSSCCTHCTPPTHSNDC